MTENEDLDDLDARLLARMLEDFLDESRENLDQLNLNLTRLEENPRDEKLINEIFRIAHTLKGTAGFTGLVQIMEVAHKMEDVFGAFRDKTLSVSSGVIDIMFEGLEVLTRLRENAVAGSGEGVVEVDISEIVNKLEQVLNQKPEIGEDTEKAVSRTESPSSHPSSPVEPTSEPASEPPPETPWKSAPEPPAPEPTHEIPGESNLEAVREAMSSVAAFGSETIRVPIRKLDLLMNLVGELITNRNRLNEFSSRLNNDGIETIAGVIDRLTGQLQNSVMSVRMVPIERLFIKFPGVVRNLARERKKEVEFVLEGKETELDKNVIEQISDPLIHLLRNCVDHGIETPEARLGKGKPGAGKIRLAAWHQENNVIIEVSDDGQGIDPEKIKKTAIQKGIISKEKASGMTDDQAVRLIFAPGFSTSEVVTDVSGRGVGMDVVKEAVQRLRGVVEVHTVIGEGTTFQIQMPLTLAIIQALLVKTAGKTYALPLHTVRETMLIPSTEIRTMEKNEVVFIRGRAYPLKNLGLIMKPGSKTPDGKGLVPVVVVGLAEKRVALWVDELIGKQEVVMKSLGAYLGRVQGIEGASILADGSVTLIVDVEAAI